MSDRTHAKDASREVRILRMPTDGRTAEQITHHFLLERELAGELMRSTRSERTAIYASMYETLFREVPDHPRLTRRADERATAVANREKAELLARFQVEGSVIGEFGAGDCRFAMDLARTAERVFAIDIADQSDGAAESVGNLEIVVYDGYELPIPDESIDLMVSDQLLEHLHPDDVGLHLETVRRVLRPGGVYLIRTPHAYTGPHDISKYFSHVAQGFHLKEWTYRELTAALRAAGFRSVSPLRTVRGRTFAVPGWAVRMAEAGLALWPAGSRLWPSHYLLKEVLVAARR